MSLLYGVARRYKPLQGPLSIRVHRRAYRASGAPLARLVAILALTAGLLALTWTVGRAVDMALAVNFGR